MTVHSLLLAIGIAATALAGCTGRSTQPVQVEPNKQPAGTAPAAGQQQTTPDGRNGRAGDGSGFGNNTGTPGVPGETTEVSVTLDEAAIKSYADTANLSYKFTYTATTPSYTQSGDLTFSGGKAELKLSGLPAGRAGDMTLELLNGSTVKARGTETNKTLNKGSPNVINFTLKALGDDVTDVTINVSLEGNSGGATPGSGGGGSGNTGGGSGNGGGGSGNTSGGSGNTGGGSGNTGGGTGNTGGGDDPIKGWDGKSFLGNARWNIKPVN